MKKFKLGMLTLLTAIVISAADLHAQTVGPILMYRNTDTTSGGVATTATITTGTTDTLHDANTLYSFYTKVGALDKYTASKYVITFNVTKISGNGTARVYIQGSMDGIVWRNINIRMHGTDGFNSDTLAIAAAAAGDGTNYIYTSYNGYPSYRPAVNTAVFWVNSQRWRFMRAMIVGSGTQATIYKNFKLYTSD